MDDLTSGPLLQARNAAAVRKLEARLRTTPRLELHVITREVIRDKRERETAIRTLVESGRAAIEVEMLEKGGRPRTIVVAR